MELKLYGALLSPFVRKARILFGEKGLDYKMDPRVAPGNFPDGYEQLHPLKRIPTLEITIGDDTIVIPDSSAVCAWSDKHTPTPSFYPADSVQHARAIWLEELADTGLAEAVGLNTFRPILFNMIAKKPPDIEAAQKGLARVRELLAYVEKQITPSGFLAGDALSIADIAIGSQILNLSYAGYTIKESDGKGLYNLYQKFLAIKTVVELLPQEQKLREQLGIGAPPQLA